MRLINVGGNFREYEWGPISCKKASKKNSLTKVSTKIQEFYSTNGI